MKEFWKPVKGYKDYYEVSNKGRVYSYISNRILSNKFVNSCGYRTVKLTDFNESKSFTIHRLVALAFLPPNKENKRTINHIDGDKINNWVNNLEWATYKENFNHGLRTGLIGRARGTEIGCAKLNDKKVKEIKRKFKNGVKQAELAREYDVGHVTIWRVVRNKKWLHVK